MKKFDLSQTITILANLGVLIGIALILIELNQSRQLAEAQFRLDVDQTYRAAEVAMMESGLSDAWATSISRPESLTVAEIRSLDSFYATIINRWANTFRLEQEGLANDGATLGQMDAAPFFFGNPFAVRWWSYDRENWPADFAATVDRVIAEVDAQANERWILDLQSDFEQSE
jgi:hypothetical protein